MNARLLRQLLTWIEDHPSQVDVSVYGQTDRSCGPVADVAGWTLLLSGWELVADNTFKRVADGREIGSYEEIEAEAQAALGLTDDQVWAGSDLDTLFTLGPDEAVTRLRELAEEAEAVAANG